MKFKWIFSALFLLSACGPGEPLYFVFLHSNPDKPALSQDSVMALQSGHMANIEKLSGEGILKAAGPFDGGGGLFIMNVSSQEKLDSLLLTDPAISAGRFRIESHTMTIAEGRLCPPDTAFNMESYLFFVFDPLNSREKKDLNNLLAQNAIEKIFIFRFQDTGNENYILRTENSSLADSLINNLIPNNKIQFSKNLWIAKETFNCN